MTRVSVEDILEVINALEQIENRKLNRSRAFLYLTGTGKATSGELAGVMGYNESRGYTRHLDRLVNDKWAKKQDWGLYAPTVEALRLMGSLPIAVTEIPPNDPFLIGKVVIVGAAGVQDALRKAGIFERALESGSYLDTIGFDVFTSILQEEKHFIRLQCWHCSPDPKFAHLRPHYYKNADCVIVACEDVPPLTTGAILGELHEWIRKEKRSVPIIVTSLVPKFRELQEFLESESFDQLGAVPAIDLEDAARKAANVIISLSKQPDRIFSVFSDLIYQVIALSNIQNNNGELTSETLSEELNLTLPIAKNILSSLEAKDLIRIDKTKDIFVLTPIGKQVAKTLVSLHE